MKYRDIITVFLVAISVLSLAYVLGVDKSLWFIPVILFALLVFMIYKLWVEK